MPKTGSLLGCSSQQPLLPSSWLFSKCWFFRYSFVSSCSLTSALLHKSFRSSFTRSSIKLPLGGGPQSSGLGPLLFLLYSLLRRGSGREDLHVCTPTSDLLSELFQNKIVACLSRKDGFCMSENVMCLVCSENTIGVCNLVNGRKVVNCIKTNPSWLSIKWK